MYDRLKPLLLVEEYASTALKHIITIKKTKLKELASPYDNFTEQLLSNLQRKVKNWNLAYIQNISDYFCLKADEFLRCGRILYEGVPEVPQGEVEGTRPNSVERFGKLYENASAGRLVSRLYPTEAALAWSKTAVDAYLEGKIADNVMRAMLRDMVLRLEAEPRTDIHSKFGILQ